MCVYDESYKRLHGCLQLIRSHCFSLLIDDEKLREEIHTRTYIYIYIYVSMSMSIRILELPIRRSLSITVANKTNIITPRLPLQFNRFASSSRALRFPFHFHQLAARPSVDSDLTIEKSGNQFFHLRKMSSIPQKMKGVIIEKTGGVEVLDYRTDLPVPEPKEGEVLVKNEFVGINYIDTYVFFFFFLLLVLLKIWFGLVWMSWNAMECLDTLVAEYIQYTIQSTLRYSKHIR